MPKFFTNASYETHIAELKEQLRTELEKELRPQIETDVMAELEPVIREDLHVEIREEIKNEGINSDESYFRLETDGIKREGGLIKMEMDWNRHFINNIKSYGCDGESDEECVQLFMLLITAPALADQITLYDEDASQIDTIPMTENGTIHT